METPVSVLFLLYSWHREAVGTVPLCVLSTSLHSYALWDLMGLHPSVDRTGTVLVAHVDTTHDPLGAGDAFSSITTFPLCPQRGRVWWHGSESGHAGQGLWFASQPSGCDTHRNLISKCLLNHNDVTVAGSGTLRLLDFRSSSRVGVGVSSFTCTVQPNKAFKFDYCPCPIQACTCLGG